MKPWIKSISINDPVLAPIMKTFGWEGVGKFLAVLEYCADFDIIEIDEELIKKQTGSNVRGARTLLPLFQETLFNVLPRLSETFAKQKGKFSKTISKVSSNFSQSLTKLEASKPYGSTRDLEEKRREEKRREDPPLPPIGGDEKKVSAFDEFYEKYPKKTTKQPSQAFWTKNRLDAKLPEILAGLQRYKVSDLWTKENGAYICDPIRFLTKEKWLDHPEPPRIQAVKRPVGTMLGGNEITPAHLRPNGPIKL